jgi:hypothetical protein
VQTIKIYASLSLTDFVSNISRLRYGEYLGKEKETCFRRLLFIINHSVLTAETDVIQHPKKEEVIRRCEQGTEKCFEEMCSSVFSTSCGW